MSVCSSSVRKHHIVLYASCICVCNYFCVLLKAAAFLISLVSAAW